MERMFKRVGLHSSKRVTDSEKQLQSVDDIAVFETISDSDRSPGSGDHQWCDLLSFKTVCVAGTAAVSASNNQMECEGPVTRRQRKLRVFNFHYLDSHAMEFKPRALTRRLCGGKKQDNELYRSNSFKFERFERLEDSGHLTKQVRKIHIFTYKSLCID